MEIVIVGGGAVGSTFGALLSKVTRTTLLMRRDEHAAAIASSGLTLRTNGGETTYRPLTSADPAVLASADTILVLTKTYQTAGASATIAAHASSSAMIASLQNGIGAVDVLNDSCGSERVVAGSTGIAAIKLDDTTVDVSHIGTAVVGEQDGSISVRCKELAQLLTDAGFEGSASNNIWSDVWTKLGISVGQNAMSALCDMTFGEMASSPQVLEIVRALTTEFGFVADFERIPLAYEPYERLMDNWSRVQSHRSSMWQDIAGGRLTEIDAMNGAIVRLAAKHNIPTPVNATITDLIKIKESKQ